MPSPFLPSHPAVDAGLPQPAAGLIEPAAGLPQPAPPLPVAPAPALTGGRIGWLDTARGLGIILVVAGHVFGSGGPVLQTTQYLIYLFHMPLFFILSGWTQKRRDLPTLIRTRAQRLLLPYLSGLVLLAALFIGRRLIQGDDVDYSTYLLGGGWLGGEFGTLWFLTCLFFAQVMFGVLLIRLRASRGLAMMAAMALMLVAGYGVIHLPYGTMTPLAIGVAPIAVVFLWAGHCLANASDGQGRIDRRLLVASLFVVLACIILGATGVAVFGMDMKLAQYGTPVLGAGLAVALSVLALEASRHLDRLPYLAPALRSLGLASMVIMLFHEAIIIAVLHHVASPWLRLAIGLGGAYAIYRVVERVPLLRLLLTGEARRSAHAAPVAPAIASS